MILSRSTTHPNRSRSTTARAAAAGPSSTIACAASRTGCATSSSCRAGVARRGADGQPRRGGRGGDRRDARGALDHAGEPAPARRGDRARARRLGRARGVADAAHAAAARDAGAPHVLVAGDELERALAAASDAPLDLAGPAGGTMMYTGGTSGRPKGVRRARPATLGAALDAQRRAGRGDRARRQRAAPRDGPALSRRAAALRGLRPAERRADDRDAALGRSARRCACCANATSTTRTSCRPCSCACCGSPDAERAAFRAPSLHLVLHGAAPIAPPVKQRMIEWWGPVLVEYWGGTESGVVTLVGFAGVARAPGHGRSRAAALGGVRGRRRRPPPAARREPARSTRVTATWQQPFVYHRDAAEDGARLSRARRADARRRRLGRRRRLRLPLRSQVEHDHLGRREHLSGRDRAGARRAPRGRRRRASSAFPTTSGARR